MPSRPRYSLRRLCIDLGGVFLVAAIIIAGLFLAVHVVANRYIRVTDQIECQVPE